MRKGNLSRVKMFKYAHKKNRKYTMKQIKLYAWSIEPTCFNRNAEAGYRGPNYMLSVLGPRAVNFGQRRLTIANTRGNEFNRIVASALVIPGKSSWARLIVGSLSTLAFQIISHSVKSTVWAYQATYLVLTPYHIFDAHAHRKNNVFLFPTPCATVQGTRLSGYWYPRFWWAVYDLEQI